MFPYLSFARAVSLLALFLYFTLFFRLPAFPCIVFKFSLLILPNCGLFLKSLAGYSKARCSIFVVYPVLVLSPQPLIFIVLVILPFPLVLYSSKSLLPSLVLLCSSSSSFPISPLPSHTILIHPFYSPHTQHQPFNCLSTSWVKGRTSNFAFTRALDCSGWFHYEARLGSHKSCLPAPAKSPPISCIEPPVTTTTTTPKTAHAHTEKLLASNHRPVTFFQASTTPLPGHSHPMRLWIEILERSRYQDQQKFSGFGTAYWYIYQCHRHPRLVVSNWMNRRI